VDGRCLRRVRGLVLRQDEPRAPFWHSFDLALTRFGGKRAPAVPGVDYVTREAYSHEVASFGFWPGDEELRESSYYAYAAPEPAGLRETTLRPEAARWSERRGGSLALLPYEAVRTADEPKAALLAFLESAYAAGADVLCWDRAELESSWCPRPACPARAALAMTAALDGNAIGGLLREVFGRKLTAETGVCARAARRRPSLSSRSTFARPVPSYGVGAATRC
jgi:hypothetical protein